LQPSVEVVVADAGPLIALARLDALPLLSALFARVWVTETVLAECVAGGERSESKNIRAAVAADQLHVRPAPTGQPAWAVDAGEASASATALELRAGVVMDDRAGRRLAARMGLPVVGVLGVLVLAKRAWRVSEIRPLVQALTDSGYYLAGSVVDQALALAGESATENAHG
jgi:predicted nucleic acid-binding protein